MRGLPGALEPELVVVSPLLRTLETAVGIFGSVDPAWLAGEDGPLLMTAIDSVLDVSGDSHFPALQPRGFALLAPMQFSTCERLSTRSVKYICSSFTDMRSGEMTGCDGARCNISIRGTTNHRCGRLQRTPRETPV